MNDTLAVKDLSMATIDAAELPGAARNFPRVAGIDPAVHLRRSFHIGSLSPTTIRLSHQPRKTADAKQRSLFAVDQTLARLDAQSNPLSYDEGTVAFQTTIPASFTLSEYRTMVATLCGALLEGDGALITAIYNGET